MAISLGRPCHLNKLIQTSGVAKPTGDVRQEDAGPKDQWTPNWRNKAEVNKMLIFNPPHLPLSELHVRLIGFLNPQRHMDVLISFLYSAICYGR